MVCGKREFELLNKINFIRTCGTEEEKQASIAWETKQLEIMDWLTDDTDWITGEKHDHIALIAKQ